MPARVRSPARKAGVCASAPRAARRAQCSVRLRVRPPASVVHRRRSGQAGQTAAATRIWTERPPSRSVRTAHSVATAPAGQVARRASRSIAKSASLKPLVEVSAAGRSSSRAPSCPTRTAPTTASASVRCFPCRFRNPRARARSGTASDTGRLRSCSTSRRRKELRHETSNPRYPDGRGSAYFRSSRTPTARAASRSGRSSRDRPIVTSASTDGDTAARPVGSYSAANGPSPTRSARCSPITRYRSASSSTCCPTAPMSAGIALRSRSCSVIAALWRPPRPAADPPDDHSTPRSTTATETGRPRSQPSTARGYPRELRLVELQANAIHVAVARL